MIKTNIAMQGKFTTKQRTPSSVDDPRHAYYPTETFLVRTDIIVSITIFIKVFLQV
jgi:hypothetical protein